MLRLRAAAALLGALLLASVPFPAAGSAVEAALVARGEGEGNLWYAVRVPAGTREGSMDAIVHAGDADADFFATRLYLYDENRSFVSRTGLALYGPEYRAKVALDGLPPVEVSVERHLYGGGAWLRSIVSWGCETCEPIASDFYLVDVLSIENAVRWSYEVRSDDEGDWGITHGVEAFVYTERHFEGGLTLQALDATANLDAKLAIRNDATLVGFFSADGWLRAKFAASTPHGDVACPCEFVHATGDASWGPGDYAFRLDRNLGGAAMLHGAIIRLPTP